MKMCKLKGRQKDTGRQLNDWRRNLITKSLDKKCVNAIYDINLKASTTATPAAAAESKAKNGSECAMTVKKMKKRKKKSREEKSARKKLCVYFQSNFQATEKIC